MLVNLKEILEVANKNNFAVPAFNTSSNMILSGILEASEELQSPLIVAIHPDELHFVRPSFVKAVVEEAHNASIPVCIHLDHGASFEQVIEAIQCGYTSVMIDASKETFENNIKICKQVVEAAHAVNVSVEGELGTIGNTDSNETTPPDQILYTDPEQAKQFVAETKIDALAVAIGTSHGIYPKDKKPELRIDILDLIKKAVDIPLVLHGGSSNKDTEIAKSVEHGVNKINISSDIKDPFYRKCREVLKDDAIREPNLIYPACIEVLKDAAKDKIRLFHSDGKANLYR
ncbi:ketose-bisphosphate aldolase [Lachnospiraceae bacterium ZAX-1]